MPTWDLVHFVLLGIALVNLAFVLGCIVLLTLGRFLTRRLIEVPTERDSKELAAWPSISLIAPARNEERHIEQAVRSLTRLDYPQLEITIIGNATGCGLGRHGLGDPSGSGARKLTSGQRLEECNRAYRNGLRPRTVG